MSQMAQGNQELVKIIEEISKECEHMSDDDRYLQRYDSFVLIN